MNKFLNILFLLVLPLGLGAENKLLRDFDIPVEELSVVYPFYEAVAAGNIDAAMQYIKQPPENFVGASKSIAKTLAGRSGAEEYISISWKSYPQWSEDATVWVVTAFYEEKGITKPDSTDDLYPRVFTDVWVRDNGKWKMVPDDFVYSNIDVYYQDYLRNLDK